MWDLVYRWVSKYGNSIPITILNILYPNSKKILNNFLGLSTKAKYKSNIRHYYFYEKNLKSFLKIENYFFQNA
jgi:hypothetical protein